MTHGTNKRKIGNGYYALRWKILVRDNFTCRYCGQHAPNVKLEVDHVTPIANGGSDQEDNLVTSCWACNKGKEALTIIIERRQQSRPIAQPLVINQNDNAMLGKKLSGKTGQLLEILRNEGKDWATSQLANAIGSSPSSVGVMKARLKKYGAL
jgi:hypothetical protein